MFVYRERYTYVCRHAERPRVLLHPAAVRCDMVLHQVFRGGRVRKNGIGGEVRHGVTSGVSCEISKTCNVTPHLHGEYCYGRCRYQGTWISQV